MSINNAPNCDDLANFVCYDDNEVYCPYLEVQDNDCIKKIYNLFAIHAHFQPVSAIEHYYCGIYREKYENYLQMKQHYEYAANNNIDYANWMLAKHYHLIERNFSEAKLYYKKVYKSLYNDMDFISLIISGTIAHFGYSKEHIVELFSFLNEEASINNPHACYLYGYGRLGNYDDFHIQLQYLQCALLGNIQETLYVLAKFYSLQYVDGYFTECVGDNQFYDPSIANDYFVTLLDKKLILHDGDSPIDIHKEYIHFLRNHGYHEEVLFVFDKYCDEFKDDNTIHWVILNSICELCKSDYNKKTNKIVRENEYIINFNNKYDIFDLIVKYLPKIDMTKKLVPIGVWLLKESLKSNTDENVILKISI